jgi:hypothetical protein
MRLSISYLDSHEVGLCCYLMVQIENLLRPFQLFYFHLWHVYWRSLLSRHVGRATAQVLSRWLPTKKARVRSRVTSCEICGGQSGTGAGFLRTLELSLPILIPPAALHSSIVKGWYSRAATGRRTKWAQSHSTPRNKTNSDISLNRPRQPTTKLQASEKVSG